MAREANQKKNSRKDKNLLLKKEVSDFSEQLDKKLQKQDFQEWKSSDK